MSNNSNSTTFTPNNNLHHHFISELEHPAKTTTNNDIWLTDRLFENAILTNFPKRNIIVTSCDELMIT